MNFIVLLKQFHKYFKIIMYYFNHNVTYYKILFESFINKLYQESDKLIINLCI